MEVQQRNCAKHGLVKHFKSTKYFWKCQQCNVELVSEARRRNKQKLIDYHGGKCVKCGYDRCVAALEFHHTEPEHKDFGIGKYGTRSLKRLIEETKKCILVCSNCHKEIHYSIHL